MTNEEEAFYEKTQRDLEDYLEQLKERKEHE